MLNRVNFPLTKTQVSDFVLDKEYTNFLTLQQVMGELIDAKLMDARQVGNRTHLAITPEGRQTLQFFENRLSDTIKKEIDTYITEHELTLRNEVSIQSDYYKSTSGEYEAHLVAKDRGIKLVDITLSVPVEEMASAICDNWQAKNQEVYQFLVEQLF